MTHHAPEESARVANRIPAQDRLPVSAPDPGKGWRLVTDYSEAPHPKAQFYADNPPGWNRRAFPQLVYPEGFIYRVPIDPAPVPPIPLSEDPLPFVNEPDRSPAVVVWIVGALVFVTGFLLGWSI